MAKNQNANTENEIIVYDVVYINGNSKKTGKPIETYLLKYLRSYKKMERGQSVTKLANGESFLSPDRVPNDMMKGIYAVEWGIRTTIIEGRDTPVAVISLIKERIADFPF